VKSGSPPHLLPLLALLLAGPCQAAGAAVPDGLPLAKLDRSQRVRVYDLALAVCLTSLADAQALSRGVDEGQVAFELGFFLEGDEVERSASGLPAGLPTSFITAVEANATAHGRQLWMARLSNTQAAFALPDACREYSRARYKTRKAYRQFDRHGRLPEIDPVSDDELQAFARQRQRELHRLQQPDAWLAGTWGEDEGCRTGRVYTFDYGVLRMDPRPGRIGGPAEYLPMRLVIDEFRPQQAAVVSYTDSGESFRVVSKGPNAIELQAERVATGSICSTFVGGGRLYRCPQ
jgi:hypothetical protein